MEEAIVTKNQFPGEEQTYITLGETPVTGVGLTWLPVSQLVAWGIFTRTAAKRNPGRSRIAWSAEGFLKMLAALGSEWCHNLAHLLASNWIHKPMDQLRIQLGMPRCIYREINDTDVKPSEHIVRSLGGPLINMLLLPLGWLGRKMTREDSILGEVAKTFYQTNLFLSLVSLLPIPGIDGGPLLKWSLVKKGQTVQQADEVVRQVNGPLALGLGLFSSWSFGKKRSLLGIFSLMLSVTSLAVFAGWLKEEDVSI